MKKILIFIKCILITISMNASIDVLADTSEKLQIAKKNYCQALKEYVAELEPEEIKIKKKYTESKELEIFEKARLGVIRDYKIEYKNHCSR